jgi:hypothetical protein
MHSLLVLNHQLCGTIRSSSHEIHNTIDFFLHLILKMLLCFCVTGVGVSETKDQDDLESLWH